MITTANNQLAAQLAQIADENGTTVRFIANRWIAQGLEGVTAELIATAQQYHRDAVDATMRRARQLNNGVEVKAAEAVVAEKVAPVVKKERVMGEVVRAKIFGFSATAVLRWMGANGWNFEDAAVVMATAGCARIADVTIRLQLKAGKDGLRGPAAPVTPAQARKLVEMSK